MAGLDGVESAHPTYVGGDGTATGRHGLFGAQRRAAAVARRGRDEMLRRELPVLQGTARVDVSRTGSLRVKIKAQQNCQLDVVQCGSSVHGVFALLPLISLGKTAKNFGIKHWNRFDSRRLHYGFFGGTVGILP